MRKEKKYPAVIIPAVTPLTEKLSLDEAAVERLFRLFEQQGAAPFILGTTGESASLPLSLKKEYVRTATRLKKPGTPLFAGIGSNVLAESVEFAEYCALQGVDVLVATLPTYYNLNPGQILRYFTRLADLVSLPLFMYNIPATTHMSIPLELIDELSHHPRIAGIKDSERDEGRMRASLEKWAGREDFHYILGWAAKSAEALLAGADGLVPSTGNLYPDIYASMIRALEQGDRDTLFEMQKLSDEYGALYQSGRTLGESLKVLKELMKEKGICDAFMMPPL